MTIKRNFIKKKIILLIILFVQIKIGKIPVFINNPISKDKTHQLNAQNIVVDTVFHLFRLESGGLCK